MKILIAADKENTMNSLKNSLIELGYADVVYVKDVSEAVVNVSVNELDLIMVDQQLNENKGLEFIRNMREMHPGLKVPMALMTEETDQNQNVRTIITNSIDYSLQKPVTVMGLVGLFSKIEK